MSDARPLASDVERGLLEKILRVFTTDAELQPRHPHEAADLPGIEQELLGNFGAATRRLNLDFHHAALALDSFARRAALQRQRTLKGEGSK